MIEKAGRLCHKTEKRIEKGSAEKFVEKLMKMGHFSVIEHVNMTVRLVLDRGISHEIVRYRL